MRKDFDWSIKVIKAENGFIVEFNEQMDDDSYRVVKEVFEDTDEDEFSELYALERVLRYIQEYFGLGFNKHSKKNLVVDIEETI